MTVFSCRAGETGAKLYRTQKEEGERRSMYPSLSIPRPHRSHATTARRSPVRIFYMSLRLSTSVYHHLPVLGSALPPQKPSKGALSTCTAKPHKPHSLAVFSSSSSANNASGTSIDRKTRSNLVLAGVAHPWRHRSRAWASPHGRDVVHQERALTPHRSATLQLLEKSGRWETSGEDLVSYCRMYREARGAFAMLLGDLAAG